MTQFQNVENNISKSVEQTQRYGNGYLETKNTSGDFVEVNVNKRRLTVAIEKCYKINETRCWTVYQFDLIQNVTKW